MACESRSVIHNAARATIAPAETTDCMHWISARNVLRLGTNMAVLWVPLRLVVLLVFLALGTSARAQLPTPKAFPNVELGVAGEVYSVAMQPDGAVVLGGRFTHVDGVPRSNLARQRADGSLDTNWNPAPDGLVLALAIGTDGAVYVGGEFTRIGGQPRNNLAKLSAAGSLVPDWRPDPSGKVLALHLDNGGWLYAGGNFEEIEAMPHRGLARMRTVDAAVDPVWAPLASSPYGQVNTIATAHAGDWVFVGGSFGLIGGQNRPLIAKLSASGGGLADPDWNPRVIVSFVTTIQSIAIDDQDRVYIGGGFNWNGPNARVNLVRVSGTGTAELDLDWNPWPGGGVTSVVLTDDHLYVGGAFTSIGGQSRQRLARLALVGTGHADPSWSPSLNQTVNAIAVAEDGTVVAGGTFDTVNGQSQRSLISIHADGSLAAAVNVDRSGGHVWALAQLPDGRILVGGSFVTANQRLRRNLLMLRADGTLDLEWSAHSDGEVGALAVADTGAIYVAGGFTEIGGLARSHLAKLSMSDGAVDPIWNPSPDEGVGSLALSAAGGLYVSGWFQTIGGLSRPFLARIDGSGSGDADMAWVLPIPPARVGALAVDGEDRLYAEVTHWEQTEHGRYGILRLDSNGNIDPNWVTRSNIHVDGLAMGPDGYLYISGPFNQINGQNRPRLARLDTSAGGHADLGWAPMTDRPSNVIAVTDSGDVYVKGSPDDTFSGERLIRFDGSAFRDPDWQPTFRGYVNSVLIGGDNAIYVGGDYQSVGGHPRSGVVALPVDWDEIFSDGDFESHP